jgi:hypothetical protein
MLNEKEKDAAGAAAATRQTRPLFVHCIVLLDIVSLYIMKNILEGFCLGANAAMDGVYKSFERELSFSSFLASMS